MRGAGKGTGQVTQDPFDPTVSVPAPPNRDISTTTGAYDISIGMDKSNVLLLTEFGGGGLQLHARETTTTMIGGMPVTSTRLVNDDDALDIHGTLIAGYRVATFSNLRLIPFVGIGTSFLSSETQSDAGRRYMIGLEIEAAASTKRSNQFFGLAARIGYAHIGGVEVDMDSERTWRLDIGAVLLQVGGYFSLDIRGDDD